MLGNNGGCGALQQSYLIEGQQKQGGRHVTRCRRLHMGAGGKTRKGLCASVDRRALRLGWLLADDDHASTGVAGRIEPQRELARSFSSVTGFGDDSVLLGLA